MHVLGLSFSGSIGAGSLATIIIATAGVVAYWYRSRQGDPGEWREQYMAEVVRRETCEQRLAAKETELGKLRDHVSELRAATDLTSLEHRMAERFDALFELNEKTLQQITGLVAAMQELIVYMAPFAPPKGAA